MLKHPVGQGTVPTSRPSRGRHLEELGDVCNARQEHNNLGYSRATGDQVQQSSGAGRATWLCQLLHQGTSDLQEPSSSPNVSMCVIWAGRTINGLAEGQELRERDCKSPLDPLEANNSPKLAKGLLGKQVCLSHPCAAYPCACLTESKLREASISPSEICGSTFTTRSKVFSHCDRHFQSIRWGHSLEASFITWQ